MLYRSIKLVFIVVVLFLLGSFHVFASPMVDQGFGTTTGIGAITDLSKYVDATVIQSDNKIIIGGAFPSFNGTTRNNIARLNTDGSVDTSFDPGTGTNGAINAVALQADGKIIIAGSFTTFNGATRNGIARINTDGTLDTSFDPGTGTNGAINAVALQADGKIIIAGSFTTYNGTIRNRIARINTDGTLDTSFDPGTGFDTDNGFSATAIQVDGKIIVGGGFATYNGTARSAIARINTDGTLDTSFDPGTGFTGSGGGVRGIVIQSDNKVIAAGDFLAFNGTTRNFIARINTDGTLDTSFDPGTGFNNKVASIDLQADGKIITAGFFSSYNSTTQNFFTRINSNGTLDTSINPDTGANSYIYVVRVQPDGKFLAGGVLSIFDGIFRRGFARLFSVPHTSTLSYTAGANGIISGSALQTITWYGADGSQVTASPYPHYAFVNWSDGSTQNPRTDTNVTTDISVTANFAEQFQTLTYTAGAHGTLSGSTSQTILSTDNGTAVTAVPDTGYAFVNWSDGSTQNPRTDMNVTTNISVTANFVLLPTATYTAGTGGTISGVTPQTISYRGSGTAVTAVPDTGYVFVNWSDGSTQNPRTDTNVTTDISVTANFSAAVTFTYTAGAHGTISGTTTQVVSYGTSGTAVTAVPDTGYVFVNWSDGSTQDPRTDTAGVSNLSVTANFAIATFAVQYSVTGGGGTLSGSTSQTVNYGESSTYVTAVPSAGFRFVGWNDGSTANPRRDTNVTAITIKTATFTSCNTFTTGGTTAIPQFSTVVGTKIYVNNSNLSTVGVFDTTTNTLLSSITVGSHPLTSTLVGTKLYVMNSAASTVSVIDTTTDTVSSTITVGTNPKYSTLVGTKLYVSNSGSSNVSVIDTTNDTVTATLTVGVTVGPSTLVGTSLYVSTGTTTGKVYVINTSNDTVGTNITVGLTPLFSTAVGTKLYVNNSNTSTVSVINTATNTVSSTITVGLRPYASTLVGTKLYVNIGANGSTTTVYVINTTNDTVSTNITVGLLPKTSTLVGTKLYVSNSGASATTVSIIDTSTDTVSSTITTGNRSTSSVLVGTKLYTNNSGSNTTTVIDTATDALISCPATHTCTYASDANGTISGDTTQIITDGQTARTVTAVPNNGYRFSSWSDASTTNPRTDTNVTGDLSVTANFIVAPVRTLTYIAGTHGTISGTASQSVNDGSDGTAVTAIPDTGYDFLNWSDASTANPRTDTNVTGDLSVTANFVAQTRTLSYTAGAHGSLTGNTSQTVDYATSGTAVTAVPDTGYSFVNWSDAVTDNPRTDTSVTTNVSVTANFAVQTQTLTYTAGSGGTLLGGTSQVVNYGSDGVSVTAIPDSGYTFTRWSDNSIQNPRTDTNVTTDITISAIFTAIPSSGGGYSGVISRQICNDPKATNYEQFGTANQSLCKYISKATLGGGNTCPATQQLTQNLKAPSRNGKYDKYTKGIVKEAKILQGHLNRLGFSAGPIDGILGPKSDGAIKRMQKFLGTKQDGYVGPITRGLLNSSCEK